LFSLRLLWAFFLTFQASVSPQPSFQFESGSGISRGPSPAPGQLAHHNPHHSGGSTHSPGMHPIVPVILTPTASNISTPPPSADLQTTLINRESSATSQQAVSTH
jgi:hypothetical protein